MWEPSLAVKPLSLIGHSDLEAEKRSLWYPEVSGFHTGPPRESPARDSIGKAECHGLVTLFVVVPVEQSEELLCMKSSQKDRAEGEGVWVAKEEGRGALC